MTTGFFDGKAAHTLLMQYSEWLDGEKIQVANADDGLTHENLVDQFIAQRNINAFPMLERSTTANPQVHPYDGELSTPDDARPYRCPHHGTDCYDVADDLGNFCEYGEAGELSTEVELLREWQRQVAEAVNIEPGIGSAYLDPSTAAAWMRELVAELEQTPVQAIVRDLGNTSQGTVDPGRAHRHRRITEASDNGEDK